MMECRDLTNDVLVDRLAPAARAHLEGCAACRARRAELRPIESALSALGRAAATAENPALVRRILARIPKQAAPSGSPWRWVAGVAAAAAILLAILVATPARETPKAPQREMVAVPAPPPIETVLDPVPPAPAPAPKAPEPVRVPVEVPRETPAPRPPVEPAPAPVEPPPPAPAPAETPKPVAPPPGTKPARVVLTLAAVDGALDLQDGAAWKKVLKTAEWDEASALRTTDRIARFTLPDGTRATLRPRSELRILAATPPSLSLERGEAFFEVIPGAGRRFSVLTADARIQVTGTQFSVKRNDHTEVYVSAGEVRIGNDKGEVAVPAGTATSARKGAAPAKPREMDTDRANAWRRELDGPETVRFRYDFEDGRLPLPWASGRVVDFGPKRGLNRWCLLGGPNIDIDTNRMDKRIATMGPGLKLRFRYWTAGADMIWPQFFSEQQRSNFRFEIKTIAKEKWETVEIPLADFFRLADGAKLQDGDHFTWFGIAVAGAVGDIYFDDVELVEAQK